MRYLPRPISFLLVFVWVAVSFTGGSPVTAANTLTLPAGFVDEVAYGGLLTPRAFTWTPDGRVLVTERGSASSGDSNLASIRVFKNGVLLPTRAYTVNTCGDSERGLLGIVTDPNFLSNGYIYIYYTRQATSGPICDRNTFNNGNNGGPRNRVSRLTMSGDVVVAGSERILVDGIASDGGNHNAGDLHFGPDGYLYISTGDGGADPTLSPNTGTLNGKILRILPTPGVAGGYTTTGNPYNTDPNALNCLIVNKNDLSHPCKEIFAKGFRNPFRFTMQPNMAGIPGTGLPFVGDVGQNTWEEVDLVHSGGDYGWPVREGFCANGVVCTPPYQTVSYDNPLYMYQHVLADGTTSASIIGGDFYLGGANYPTQYLNNYFFAEYVHGYIGRLIYNTSTSQWVHSPQNFATGGSAIIGLKRGLDGNLYYLSITSGVDPINVIRRIRYTGSLNKPPTAQAAVNPQSGPLSTTYTFSAAGSTDPDNNIPLTYNWDFGDGTTVSTQNLTVTHVYNTSVNVAASLTVTDSGNPAVSSDPVFINLYPGNIAPSGSIVLTNVTDGTRPTTFYGGDIWTYSAANVTDDAALPANAIEWEIVFHHQSHTHPFVQLVQANGGQFTIPTTGELDPVVFYRAHLYITDARGQRVEFTKDIQPVTTVLTFTTSPTSGRVIIAGGTFSTPLTITRVVGMQFGVSVTSPQSIWGASYTFNNWSQGGSAAQTIIVPDVDTTYTANFNPPANAAPPKNYFTTHTPTLTWNRITTAVRYMLQIGTNAGFTGAPIYEAGNNLAFTLPTPLPDGFYYWRVAGCASATVCSNWSATDTFVVDAP